MLPGNFNRWLAELQPAMRRWVPRHHKHDAADVIQDANCIALSAWRSNPSMHWENINAFSSWLRMTVISAAGMADRKYWCESAPWRRALSLECDHTEDATHTPRAETLIDCLREDHMTEMMLDVWELAVLQGLSTREVARKLHCRRPTVLAALDKLKAFIADNTV